MRANCFLMFAILAVVCGMLSCTTQSQEQQDMQFPDIPLRMTIRNRLAAMDTALVLPDGLTEEEKVIYIENHVLTTPITAEELLALTPVHDLDPSTEWYEGGWPEEYMEKVCIANRFMRMQYVAYGDPMDELQWMEAAYAILTEYASSHAITESQALDSMLAGLVHMEAGSQFDMNQWSYVLASVEYYRTLAAYKSLIDAMPEFKKDMFIQEYKAWNKMNKARHKAYVHIRRAGDHYSSLPMEYEAMYAAYATYRRNLLTKENDVVWANKKYNRKHPIVKAEDWEDYLDTKLYRTAEDEDSALVNEVDQTVRTWFRTRKRIAKNVFSGYQDSYDNLTNDYYWTIIHEAEPMPRGYY